MNQYYIRPLMAALIVYAAPAAAQETLGGTAEGKTLPADPEEDRGASGFFAIGPGVTSAYDGAKSYQLIPFAIADVRWKGVEFELRGLRARIDLLGDSPFQIGPAANL